MLVRSNALPAAVLFASAVASKVLPLLAMPFLLRRLNWRSILLSGLTGALVLGLMGVFFFDEKAIANFRASLGLYFQHFEFNGGLFLLFKWMAGDAYFWVQRLLPWGVFAGVLWMAWKEQNKMKTISELSSPELQMRKGSKFGYGADDLTVAKWETV